MNSTFKMIGIIFALSILVLQGCRTSVYNDNRIKFLTTENIEILTNACDKNYNWLDKDTYYSQYIIEAKKRNLSCLNFLEFHLNYDRTVATAKLSNSYLKLVSSNNLCSFAKKTHNYNVEKLLLNEITSRGLDCGITKNNEIVITSKPKTQTYKPKSNLSSVTKPISNIIVSNNSKIETKADTNICSKLQTKVLSHIDNNEYEKAGNARKLMKEMNCVGGAGKSSSLQENSNSGSKQNYSKTKQVLKYSIDELRCSIGPLGKYMFREYGYYSAVAFDNNPSKGCNATYQYCKSRARAIARGAKITPSEKSPNNYSADCRIYGTNKYNTTANCSITPDTGGGGFAGGLANELGKGIERASAMKRIYISNFEICMSEMGYNLSQR